MKREEKFIAMCNQKRSILEKRSNNKYLIDGYERLAEFHDKGDIVHLSMGKASHNIYVKKIDSTSYEVWIHDAILCVKLEDHRTNLINTFKGNTGVHHRSLEVSAPMPGLVVHILTEEGAFVNPGTDLLILEAMKMENKITSKASGFIKSIVVRKGDVVEKDQVLISMREE